MKKLFAITLAVLLAACSPVSGVATPIVMTAEVGTVMPDGSGAGGVVATSPAPVIVPTELRYRVLEEFPDFFFCDPDFYPVAREDELVLAQQHFPELQADQGEFQVILDQIGLTGTTTFTDEQKLAVYREHKKLNAIFFEMSGDRYKFQIQTGLEGQQGSLVTATIDSNGSIDVLQREESFPSCPICLAAGTLIDTPRGAFRVEDLKLGDPVWTANDAGDRVAGTIIRVGNVRVPASHQMVHVLLDDGREVWASPGHPTTDGRNFSDLKLNDSLDGAQIIGLELVPYNGSATFDLLPSGDTGTYWANAVRIGSTLTNDR